MHFYNVILRLLNSTKINFLHQSSRSWKWQEVFVSFFSFFNSTKLWNLIFMTFNIRTIWNIILVLKAAKRNSLTNFRKDCTVFHSYRAFSILTKTQHFGYLNFKKTLPVYVNDFDYPILLHRMAVTCIISDLGNKKYIMTW